VAQILGQARALPRRDSFTLGAIETMHRDLVGRLWNFEIVERWRGNACALGHESRPGPALQTFEVYRSAFGAFCQFDMAGAHLPDSRPCPSVRMRTAWPSEPMTTTRRIDAGQPEARRALPAPGNSRPNRRYGGRARHVGVRCVALSPCASRGI